MPYHEKHSRSIAKAISYRIISICVDLTIVYSLAVLFDAPHKTQLTLGVVLASNSISIFVYYIHERVWNKFHFGRRVLPDKEIG
jgi:uncharacterized membrane protein